MEMHSGEQYKLHLSVCPVGKHRGPLNSLLLTSVCPSALILQNKNVTKLSHQNIVPKSQGSRLIRNHPALSCHTFLAVLVQSIPFWPFCTYLHLERTGINISFIFGSIQSVKLSTCIINLFQHHGR